jgi:hypothetical protein
MFNFRFIKANPSTHIMQFRGGKLLRSGAGLSFNYFAPTSNLVSIPLSSHEAGFMFAETTADYQQVTLQGTVIYRVSQVEKITEQLNFAIDSKTQQYITDDPRKLESRILNHIQVTLRPFVQNLPLKRSLTASDAIVKAMRKQLSESSLLNRLGITIEEFALIAIKPQPETAKALEAEIREALLREADEAIYVRRNAALVSEREVKENELQTEQAIEQKQRQISETKMETERLIQEKANIIAMQKMESKIELENKKQALVDLASDNAKKESDAKAYELSAIMQALSKVDPKVLESLAQANMEADKLFANAFKSLAEQSQKIGELNFSPDFMNQMFMNRK